MTQLVATSNAQIWIAKTAVFRFLRVGLALRPLNAEQLSGSCFNWRAIQFLILAEQQLTQILPCLKVRAWLMRKAVGFLIIKIH